MQMAGASSRLLGVSAKFWMGFWKSTVVASWKASVVRRVLPPLLSRLKRRFMKHPPNSMHPTVLRMKGCVQALTASSSQKCCWK